MIIIKVKKNIFFLKAILSDLTRSLKSRGLVQTVKLIKYNFFEKNSSNLSVEEITVNGKSKLTLSQSTRLPPFKQLLQSLDFETKNCFVDLGSGNGDLIKFCLDFGWKQAKGYELSQSLYQQSVQILKNDNAELYFQSFCNYRHTIGDDLIYLYDPCEIKVVTNLINKIDQEKKSSTKIVYHHNLLEYSELNDALNINGSLSKKIIDHQQYFIINLRHIESIVSTS